MYLTVFQVYDEIRNRHISNVFGFLSATAKDLQQGYDVSVCICMFLCIDNVEIY